VSSIRRALPLPPPLFSNEYQVSSLHSSRSPPHPPPLFLPLLSCPPPLTLGEVGREQGKEEERGKSVRGKEKGGGRREREMKEEEG
jgi:hypothetical protein